MTTESRPGATATGNRWVAPLCWSTIALEGFDAGVAAAGRSTS